VRKLDQNGVAAALREVGKLERTLFMLDWISAPSLRRETGQECQIASNRDPLSRRCAGMEGHGHQMGLGKNR